MCLTARPVHTDEDVEMLRQIRNSGREWMTRDTAEITPEQQDKWWKARGVAAGNVWLFRESATDVGYGLLRRDADGRLWCSLAVLKAHQGRGHGAAIYRWLALAVGETVWAEILADNTPSLRAAFRAGFSLMYAADRVAVLAYQK